MGQYREAYIEAPEGWDRCWRAALGRSGAEQARWAAIGDSFTQGQGSGDIFRLGWVPLVARRLREGYRDGGTFFGAWDSQDFNANLEAPSFPFTVSATDRTWTLHGFGQIPYYSLASMPADPIRFATPFDCDALDIVYFDNNSGTWSYSLDGGAERTVTVTGGLYAPGLVQLRNLVPGPHALVFTAQTDHNQTLGILGVTCYPPSARQGAAGVALARCGLSGDKVQSYVRATLHPTDRISLWQGKQLDGSAIGLGFPMQPHLATLAFGINDCSNLSGLDQFRSGLRRYVQALRRGQEGCSILLVGNANPDLVNSDVTASGFQNAENWGHYLAAMRDVAAAYGCAFVSFQARWGERSAARGFTAATNGHPNAAGHADMADVLADLICT